MNGPQHYHIAERLLGSPSMVDPERQRLALVHAVLALVAATVDSSQEINEMSSVFASWQDVGATTWEGS